MTFHFICGWDGSRPQLREPETLEEARSNANPLLPRALGEAGKLLDRFERMDAEITALDGGPKDLNSKPGTVVAVNEPLSSLKDRPADVEHRAYGDDSHFTRVELHDRGETPEVYQAWVSSSSQILSHVNGADSASPVRLHISGDTCEIDVDTQSAP